VAAVVRGDEEAARRAMHDHLARARPTYTRIDRATHPALARRSAM
jgi:DNA-binding FadR family transcriptional regulator